MSAIGAKGFSSIADYIASYLRKLIEESPEGYIEIRRNDLAAQFRCVPSQITYVLSTRFNARTGFLVESRRGGGGYVRIVKLPVGVRSDQVRRLLEAVGPAISQREAEGVILRLREEEFITPREARLMLAVCAGAASR
ncbi:MAG: Transcriptional regulator CtsR, partial [Clostridia bacterium 62_21]